MNQGTVQDVRVEKDEEVSTLEIPYLVTEVRIPVTSLMICVRFSFPYESTIYVPGKYDPTVYIQEKGHENRPLVINESSVTTIDSLGRMTRSGCIFVHIHAHNKIKESLAKAKGKEVVDVDQGQSSPKGASSKKEADEFLIIIKKSDYHVVDQLNHTSSKISILSLLLSSKAHCESLVNVLGVTPC